MEKKMAHVDGSPVTSDALATASESEAIRALDDDIGLSIDMLDVDRLREWARLILVHGADIGHWGSTAYVVGRMQVMATCIEKAVRDIGTLRNSHADLLAALKALHDDIADYARINNLGGFDNHCMKQARAAIAKATSHV